ncbi:MAG TPA: DMT family transporter, partial [Dongiaceae bacterium]
MVDSSRRSATFPSLAIAASGLLWGLWWIPLRQVEDAGLRGAWASILIFGLCALLTFPLALRGRWPTKAQLGNLLLMGVMSGITLALWNFALLTGSVVRVTLLFYLAPVWGTLFGFLFFHLPLRGFRVLTIAFGFAGAVILLGLEGLGSAPLSLADGAALISSIAFALTATYSRKLGGDITGWQKTFVSGSMGALFAVPLLALPLAAGAPPTPEIIDSVALFLLICMIWQVLLAWLVMWGSGFVEPGRVTVLLLLEVVGAAVSAAILTDEPFGWREILGCIFIVGAGLIEGF